MVKRYTECMSRWEEGQPDMRVDPAGEYVKHTDYAALAERCERLEAALREVMRPYGMYEKAVFHTTGHGQDCVLDAGRAIEALLSEKGAAP